MTNADVKTQRVMSALEHREPDRVPVGEFFWTNFAKRCRRELGVGGDFSPYHHWDLDLVVMVPNMDPHIQGIEVLLDSPERKRLKTGFGAAIEMVGDYPMPRYVDFDTKTYDQMEALEFDDPADPRRFLASGDNQISGVGDGFQRNSPPWIETVRSLRPDFPVYGSIIEASECLTRLVGQGNAMLWMGQEPDRMGAVIDRLGAYYLAMTRAQIGAAAGLLDGFVIWGDVAYKKSTFMSPAYWRKHFKPWVARMIELAHAASLPVIYHGCGNVAALLPDFIEIGVDAYNPLEAKAGLDVLDLRRRYGHKLAFCGNGDIRVLESGDPEAVKREVLRKLNAARGGGYIFQSDHSVTSGVSGRIYDLVVKLVRDHGRYPLRLGPYEESV